jgi:uncharacterized protein YndB with AHSA1/START domain
MKKEALRVTSTIPVAPTTLYFAWIDSTHHSSMTGMTAKLEPEVGAKYSASNGYVTGKLVILDLGRRIVMSWRTTDFPRDAADSRVEVHFETLGLSTRILILHTEIPEGQSEKYKALWNEKYIAPMRSYFSKFLPDPRNPPPRRIPPPPPESDDDDEEEDDVSLKAKGKGKLGAKAVCQAGRRKGRRRQAGRGQGPAARQGPAASRQGEAGVEGRASRQGQTRAEGRCRREQREEARPRQEGPAAGEEAGRKEAGSCEEASLGEEAHAREEAAAPQGQEEALTNRAPDRRRSRRSRSALHPPATRGRSARRRARASPRRGATDRAPLERTRPPHRPTIPAKTGTRNSCLRY